MPLSGGGMGCGAGCGFCIQVQAINSRDASVSSTDPDCDSWPAANGASVSSSAANMLMLRFIGTPIGRSSKVPAQNSPAANRGRVSLAAAAFVKLLNHLLLYFYFGAAMWSIRRSLYRESPDFSLRSMPRDTQANARNDCGQP